MTKTALKLRALQMLLGVGVGQTASSAQDTLIGTSYDAVPATLKEKTLATWASTADIPDAVASQVTALTAFNVAEAFAVSSQNYERIAAKAMAAEREMRYILTPAYESQEEPDDF